MGPVYLFDDGKGSLAPLTDLRPSFDVRTGALTQAERVRLALGVEPAGLFVPPGLEGLARETHRTPINHALRTGEMVTLINGRAPLACDAVERLKAGVAIVEGRDVIAARVRADQVERVLNGERAGLIEDRPEGAHLLDRPWDVIAWRDRCLERDLGILVEGPTREPPPHCVRFGHGALVIDPSAHVYPGVTFDLEHGPVVIGEGAAVRPGATIIGPAYVGPGSTVLDKALVKAHTAVGPVCKVAGEVAGVIFQGHANKAHDGHLGDSWVGEWVNLGAGTVNSNLLNTYAEVVARATPEGRNERTGLQFLGAILGDHVKTAIGTRIMTGCIAGTGVMWAATGAMNGCVPAFTWATDEGKRDFRMSKFVEVARTMMQRRHVVPGPEYLRRLESLHGA